MADTPSAIEAAQRDRLTAGAVGQIIDQWEAGRPAWDVGALFWRLTRGSWPQRATKTHDVDWSAQEKRRTRELLAGVGPRARADPDEPSLVDLFRRLKNQEGDP